MVSRRRLRLLALAATVAVFQVVGTFGAAEDQADRRPIDALAVGLVLVGPAALGALAWRRWWSLVAVAASSAAACV